MKVYLAGPMRGLPELNHPAFNKAAAHLRKLGFDVFNPAEQSNDLPKDDASGAAGGIPRREWLRRDILAVLDVDAIAVMPGWQNSPGARMEVQIGRELEKPLLDARDGKPYRETVLQEAQRLVYGDRGETYGHPLDDFTRTATMWGVILAAPVSAEQVAMCMMALKISRQTYQPKRDNVVDMAGYAECLQRIVDERERRDGHD